MSVFDEASAQRRQLSVELRGLRKSTGLSGKRFGEQTGLGQPKVSKLETGKQLPSAADLDRWADATGADQAARAKLHELREAAATEVVAWRRHFRRGLDTIQAEVKEVEQAASRIRVFHPVVIPGLLQTPAYARAIAEARHGAGHPNVAKWVAGVVDRQALLHEQGRRFEFVIGEAALRWRPGPPDLMAGQLDRIGVIAGLDNVTVGVLAFDREAPIWRSHHFTMYEQPDGQMMVHLELLAGGKNLRDPDDLAQFTEAFKLLLESTVAAPPLLARVAADL